MRKQHTKAQREQLVRLVVVEGRTVREAAQQMKVRPSTAYYWVRRAAATGEDVVANASAPEPVFARLVRAEDAASPRILELSIGGSTVLVRPDFDAALLRAVVAALREASS